ncbi:MAG: phage gp6-like head-tail connector protein [Parasporobacterium sp.]|nr:phage gp6-like head-tail connector protein [Parasporobacterium sp.]
MALITLEDAKSYLRVDSADEDAMTGILLSSAEKLCADVARLSDRQWAAVNSDDTESEDYTKEALAHIREIMKVAILYAVGYMFEHREKADYTELTLTLRSLLFAVREGVV